MSLNRLTIGRQPLIKSYQYTKTHDIIDLLQECLPAYLKKVTGCIGVGSMSDAKLIAINQTKTITPTQYCNVYIIYYSNRSIVCIYLSDNSYYSPEI